MQLSIREIQFDWTRLDAGVSDDADVSSLSSSSSSMKSAAASLRIIAKPRKEDVKHKSISNKSKVESVVEMNNKIDTFNLSSRFNHASQHKRTTGHGIDIKLNHYNEPRVTFTPFQHDTEKENPEIIIDMDSFHRTVKIEKKRETKRRMEKTFRWRMYEGEDGKNLLHPRMLSHHNLDCQSLSTSNNTSVQNLAPKSILLEEEEEISEGIHHEPRMTHTYQNCNDKVMEDEFAAYGDSPVSVYRDPHTNSIFPSPLMEHEKKKQQIVSNPTDTTAGSTSSSISMDEDVRLDTPCSSHDYMSSLDDPLPHGYKIFYTNMGQECIVPSPPPPPPPRRHTDIFVSLIQGAGSSLDSPFDETQSTQLGEQNLQLLPEKSSVHGVEIAMEQEIIPSKGCLKEEEEEEEDSISAQEGPGKIVSVALQVTQVEPKVETPVQTLQQTCKDNLNTFMQHEKEGSVSDKDPSSLYPYQSQLQQDFLETKNDTSTIVSYNTQSYLGNIKERYCPFDEHDENGIAISSCSTHYQRGTHSATRENDKDDQANSQCCTAETNHCGSYQRSDQKSLDGSSIPSKLSDSFDDNFDDPGILKVADSASKESSNRIRSASNSASFVSSQDTYASFHPTNAFLDTSNTSRDWDDSIDEIHSSWIHQDPFCDYKLDTSEERLDFEWPESDMDENGFPVSSCQKIVLHFPSDINNTPVQSKEPMKRLNMSTTRASVQKLNSQLKNSQRPAKEDSAVSSKQTLTPTRESTGSALCIKSLAYQPQSRSNQNPIQYIHMTEDGSTPTHSKLTKKILTGSPFIAATNLFATKELDPHKFKHHDQARSSDQRWTKASLFNHASPKHMNQNETFFDSHPLLIDTDINYFGSKEGIHSRELKRTTSWMQMFRRNGTNLSMEKLYQGKAIQGALSPFRRSTLKHLNSSIQTSDLVAATTLDDSGRLLYKKRDYNKAVTMFEEALRIKVRVYGLNEFLDIAESLNNIGCARVALSTPLKALSVYMEAVRILKEIVNRVDFLDPDMLRYQAITLRNIGHTFFVLRKFDDAASSYQEACTLFKMTQGSSQLWCMETLDSCVLAKRAALKDAEASSLIIGLDQYIMWTTS